MFQTQADVAALQQASLAVQLASNCSGTSLGYRNLRVAYCVQSCDALFFVLNSLSVLALLCLPLLLLLCLMRGRFRPNSPDFYAEIPDGPRETGGSKSLFELSSQQPAILVDYDETDYMLGGSVPHPDYLALDHSVDQTIHIRNAPANSSLGLFPPPLYGHSQPQRAAAAPAHPGYGGSYAAEGSTPYVSSFSDAAVASAPSYSPSSFYPGSEFSAADGFPISPIHHAPGSLSICFSPSDYGNFLTDNE